MRPLSEVEINSLWQEKEDMDPAEAPLLVEQMSKQQPNVLTYLLATGGDILDQPEREVIFYMGVLIWYVIDNIGIAVPEIPLESLFETEEKNFTMLEYLSGEPESEFLETVGKIMDSYNQSELLRYIIDKIMEEPQRDVDISENHIGVMVIYLKTFIDCIDSLV